MPKVTVTKIVFTINEEEKTGTFLISWSNDRHQSVRVLELSPQGIRSALLDHVEMIGLQIGRGLLPVRGVTGAQIATTNSISKEK